MMKVVGVMAKSVANIRLLPSDIYSGVENPVQIKNDIVVPIDLDRSEAPDAFYNLSEQGRSCKRCIAIGMPLIAIMALVP